MSQKARIAALYCTLLLSKVTALVKLLLDRGADTESKDENSCTVLHYAAQQGNIALVELLLDRGADIESKDEDVALCCIMLDVVDEGGCTPVAHAAAKGHQEIVWILLKEGADREIKDLQGLTASSKAVRGEHEAVVHLLQPSDMMRDLRLGKHPRDLPESDEDGGLSRLEQYIEERGEKRRRRSVDE